MALGIESFRRSGDRLILDQQHGGNQPTGVTTAKLPFKDRVVNFFKSGDARHGTIQQQDQNRQFKVAFLNALVKAEGPEVASRALRSAGLRDDFAASSKPMSGRQVKQILEAAETIRRDAVVVTKRRVESYMSGTGPGSFAHSFDALNAGGGLPGSDVRNPQLRQLVALEIQHDPLYGKRPMTRQEIDDAARRAIAKFVEKRAESFAEAHPDLSGLVDDHPGTARSDNRFVFTDLIAKLSPGMGQGHALSQEPEGFRYTAQTVLETLRGNDVLLGKMSYSPEGWTALEHELGEAIDRLDQLETNLVLLDDHELPQSGVGQDLHEALQSEIAHQRDLLLAKRSFVEDVRTSDPLSGKMVAYSNALWGYAAGKIIDQAIEYLNANPPEGGADEAIALLLLEKQTFIDQGVYVLGTTSPERTDLPGTVEKDRHPATLGKANAKAFLEHVLGQAGLPKGEIERLTGKKSLGEARQRALNENQMWAPVSRDMVVTRDGVTRVYRSEIKPGGSINGRFARRYALVKDDTDGSPSHEGRMGVSSATKGDHYHARNLKVSELSRVHTDGSVTGKTKLIGHGVLDMWTITDPVERQRANERGATEVIEAAITTNERVFGTALQRLDNGDDRPVKITHVSVNLITPTGLRELPGIRGKLPDYQELTYTQAQFGAFETASNGGRQMTLQVDDERDQQDVHQDVDINVQVDVISFSFAINPLATGKLSGITGGWGNVYEHNARMMEKFVGDLGDGEFGSKGSRPGGFIGTVYDRLDPNVPAEAEMMRKIEDQTNLVREMFTDETFKTGNGDPAKMSRHILALQSLAEEVLSMKNVVNEGATMSKGCKSDKDRGGVTDVELKHMLITEDMGGRILPDTTLEGDDQENYYVVASSSGQLENQLYNTGLPGSKEAGKLKERIPDKTVRQYLSGLGAFASE